MISISSIKNKRISFIDIFFPLFIILAQYSVNGFSNYGYLILISYVLIRLFFYKNFFYFHKYLLMLTIYISIISALNMYRLNLFSITMINRITMSFIINIIIACVIPLINIDNLYKSFLFIGSIAMAIMFYQSIRLFLLDIPATPITILPIASKNAHYWDYFRGTRPSSLFTEPQAYASYMLPLLILSLKKNNEIISFLISLSIFLSTSTQGLILVGIIYLYFIFIEKGNRNQKIILAIFSAILLFLLIYFDVFSFTIEKMLSLSLRNNIRLTRGFQIYNTFNIQDKILGINNTIQNYLIHNTNFLWVSSYLGAKREFLLGYTTTVSGILLEFGLVAGFLFLFMIYKMYKNEDHRMRIFLLVIFILSFTQTLLYNPWFVFYYSIYLGCCNQNIYNKNYIKL